MMRALRGSRFTGLLALVVVVAVAAAGLVIYTRVTARSTQSICALLPDSAGLYRGNSVNIRGVPIGTVSDVRPEVGHVRVRMDVDDRPLNPGLRVVAVNNSVLADRRLELIDAAPPVDDASARLTGCIPLRQTATPVSLSAAFESFTELFDGLAAPGDDSARPIGELLEQMDRQFAQSGPQVNATIGHLASFLADPTEFLSNVRTTVHNLANLSRLAQNKWGDLEAVMGQAAEVVNWLRYMFSQFVTIFTNLGKAGEGLDDMLTQVLPRALDVAEENEPAIDAAMAKLDDLTAILQHIPALAAGFQTAASGRGFAVAVHSPRVTVRTPNATALCGLVNAEGQRRSSTCTPTGGGAAVDLRELVTRAVQGGGR